MAKSNDPGEATLACRDGSRFSLAHASRITSAPEAPAFDHAAATANLGTP